MPACPSMTETTSGEYLRARDGCGDQHPRRSKPGGAASLQLIFRRRAGSPWSWHQFGRVGPDGCPGFKGPFPQPVSMSGAKFRCDSTLAQGTRAQSRRSLRETKRGIGRGAASRSRSGRAPKDAVNPSMGAPAATSMSRTAFGARPDRKRRRRGRLRPPGFARTASRLRCAIQCINVLAH